MYNYQVYDLIQSSYKSVLPVNEKTNRNKLIININPKRIMHPLYK